MANAAGSNSRVGIPLDGVANGCEQTLHAPDLGIAMLLQEHAEVMLRHPLPELGLRSGSVGVVVHVHGQGEAYEVEFCTEDGRTIGVVILKPEDLAPAQRPATGVQERQACGTQPSYPQDDGPLTETQIKHLQADADAHMPKGAVLRRTSLF